ncbi:33306_t:CDS:1, partial [Racocetra persica]
TKWFYTQALPERILKGHFHHICEITNITIGDRIISNHSGQKTSIQVLKGLEYPDSVVMSITRHKTQQGLASCERPKSVMQHQGLNRFFNALTLVSKSPPPESKDENSKMIDQVENSEMTDQGEKIYGEFTLASNYASFDTVEDFLATDLPESP